MLHRFLPISGAARALAEAGVGLGERLCSCGGQLPDSTHQPYPIRDIRTQLSVSGCSHLPSAHPAIYLSLPHSHLLPSLSLFLIFLSKTDPALSSQAWPAPAALLKEQRNDLISPPFCLCGLFSLLTHRSLHTEASFSSLYEGKCGALTSQPRHGHC